MENRKWKMANFQKLADAVDAARTVRLIERGGHLELPEIRIGAKIRAVKLRADRIARIGCIMASNLTSK